jgi:hypothetical protein
MYASLVPRLHYSTKHESIFTILLAGFWHGYGSQHVTEVKLVSLEEFDDWICANKTLEED